MKNNTTKKLFDGVKGIIAEKNREIILLKKALVDADTGEKSVVFKMPTTTTVSNFPDTFKVHIVKNAKPLEVEIRNHPKIQDVRIVNSEGRDDVKKVEVTNAEKASAWVPEIVMLAVKGLTEMSVKLWKSGITVRLDDTERLKPIPVYIVGRDGKPANIGTGNNNTHNSGGMLPMIARGGFNPTGSSMTSGRIVIPASGAIAISGTQAAKKVILTSIADNGGAVAVGGSTVSTVSGSENGAFIYPTGSVTLEIDNANKVFVAGSNPGDIITFNVIS